MGNIHAGIRNKPSMNAWIPLALLPIPPKRLDKLPDYPAKEQELDALQVIHEIVSIVLSPLTDPKYAQGINILCCNEKIRNCVPKLVAWLADHVEDCTLQAVAMKQRLICTATPNDFAELPDEPFPPVRTPPMPPHIRYPT